LGRYFLKISYDGSAYAGWQVQANAPSVQAHIADVMEKVLRQPVALAGSSRTDAGVHALGQVAQADFEFQGSLAQLQFQLNMALSPDVSILNIRPVRAEAQCRYEALSRTYRYSIARKKLPLSRQYSHSWYGNLDIGAMQTCCGIILNSVDFQAFSKIHTQVNHFECRVERACWVEESPEMLVFEVKANRFLRGMVRALAGTMLAVGKGKLRPGDFEKILHGKDRRLAGESVPAKGLCLMEVEYPESIYLPA
jgi:tRNA pseudouridine38-40 synthase